MYVKDILCNMFAMVKIRNSPSIRRLVKKLQVNHSRKYMQLQKKVLYTLMQIDQDTLLNLKGK